MDYFLQVAAMRTLVEFPNLGHQSAVLQVDQLFNFIFCQSSDDESSFQLPTLYIDKVSVVIFIKMAVLSVGEVQGIKS